MATAAASIDQSGSREGSWWRGPAAVWAVALLGALILLIHPRRLFGDGDTGWHLGAGNWILRTGTIPHVDPFSFTFRGAPWTAHEWLAEILMSGAFRLAGWNGLTVLFTLVATCTLLLVGCELLRWLPPRWAGAGLFAAACTAVPMVHARPHMLGWLLFAGWLILLLHARERRGLPPWWAPLLMAIWANLHASYILGLGIAGLFTLEALIDHRREPATALRWAAWGLLALAATTLTPLGLQGFLYPFQVKDMKVLAIITEWRPTRLPDDAPFLFYAALFWAFVATRWRRFPPLRLLLLAGLFGLALLHVRHQPLFGLTAALVAAPLFGQPQAKPHMRWGWVVGVLAVLAGARLLVPWQMPDTAEYPLTLINRLPPDLRSRPVLNDYSMGGPLIMSGIAPAIDGRADMYGDDFSFAHLAMQNGGMPKFRAFVRRWDVRWTILTRDSPLAAKLNREPGWRRYAATRDAVVHVRTR
ncbi:hypothetical protein OMW55_10780 [Sphingomonas sp. BN140010]|uniref:Glycosyltransferase RgtA/B/C/D-like domain-containing protein n=1 Tax=Sphingomonas arvum TaxID=2992113 RepID=A0ABT3JH19_9SPHN|nr:hypothetical protein [Sphingomonas sp. BN140010]MCW3798286.1 hypothetical protein [Sphingomonas sp. BN140010]